MYAVIKAGGKQHKVRPGDVIEVEHIPAGAETVTFRPILVVDDEGNTLVGRQAQAAVVTARALGEKKGDKVKVFRYRPKTGYARRQGHRQLLTLLQIEDVKLPARRPARSRARAEPPAEAEEGASAEAGAAEESRAGPSATVEG